MTTTRRGSNPPYGAITGGVLGFAVWTALFSAGYVAVSLWRIVGG